ncbi:MAG: hypothetical protein KGH60_01575 [Candidatus Micrarchaeota archaeon]|nr:hypothetical protein [Candidatus Micrarchaeota archaeon]
MGNKPTAAFILAVIGGLFVLAGGIIGILGLNAAQGILGSLPTTTASSAAVSSTITLGYALTILGVISGIVLVASGLMLYTTDMKKRKMWGIIAIVFAVISLSSLGGFIIGFVLALIGGILALVKK